MNWIEAVKTVLLLPREIFLSIIYTINNTIEALLYNDSCNLFCASKDIKILYLYRFYCKRVFYIAH